MARYTSPIGYYGVKADPGTTVTVAFDCKITEKAPKPRKHPPSPRKPASYDRKW